MTDGIESILRDIQEGRLNLTEGRDAVAKLYGEDLGFAVIDAKRHERTGYPEVVYCAGKTVDHAASIIGRMRERDIPTLGTRASAELAERVLAKYGAASDGAASDGAAYDEVSKVLTVGRAFTEDQREGLVAVVAAGTSDIPVAREAALVAEFFGSRVLAITDVGVAGIHRLFARLEEIRTAKVVVAVAGMEGALAGVLAGLVSVPVIALPTSVGYGVSFGGYAALLGMLSSCAPGISVVNIDNGFGAGYQANLINRGARG